MMQSRLWIALLLGMSLVPPAASQVPQIINYTGGVAVGGTNFNGNGQFKFALLSSNAATTFWSNDGTSAAGSQPLKGLTLAVGNGIYDVVLGDTALTNMVPIPPTVFTNAGVVLRVWFSDGEAPFEPIVPDQPVGAVGYAMMAANVADGAITASKLATGAVTASAIAPGAIGPASLARDSAAANLGASGGLILSEQGNNTSLLTNGFQKIGSVTVESDSWQTITQFTPAPRRSAGAVWTGAEMLIWGGTQASGTVLNSGGRYDAAKDTWRPISAAGSPPGYVDPKVVWTGSQMVVLGTRTQPSGLYRPATDTWQRMSAVNAPTSWTDKSIVWTGSKLLVWGGSESLRCYDPALDKWTAVLSPTTAPRTGFTATWTGTEMIVWGGGGSATSGGAYNPATATWRTLSKVNQPTPRTGHSAVWTGAYLIIWGGLTAQGVIPTATGSYYDPSNDSWKALSTDGAPGARSGHLAFWDGQDMIIWGGTGAYQLPQMDLNDGARYRFSSGTWLPISAQGAPGPSPKASAVWTGSEMILWGGGGEGARASQYPASNSGVAYRPASDTWRMIAASPSGRVDHTLVWTGTELMVWGGDNLAAGFWASSTLVADSGFRFNPITSSWAALPNLNAPTPRQSHGAVWTGDEMIVWGGLGFTNTVPIIQPRFQPLNSGARYNPAADAWAALATDGAPSPRYGFTMVWSGKEALVFGGQSGTYPKTTDFLGNGARYSPKTDSWTSMAGLQAPSPRIGHSAVWTGKEMIIWGGTGLTNGTRTTPLNTGARYNPTLNVWTPVTVKNAPSARANHIAVWTGREMIIWGGDPRGQSQDARYDPALDRWTSISMVNEPGNLGVPLGVWTGQDLLVWGSNAAAVRTGARYNPFTDLWTPTTLVAAPEGRSGALGVWTGKSVLIFGGHTGSTLTALPDALLSYSTSRTMFLYGSTRIPTP